MTYAANIDEAGVRKLAAHTLRRGGLCRDQQADQIEHLTRALMSKPIDLEYSLLFIKLSIVNLQETFVLVSLQTNQTVTTLPLHLIS